MAEDALLNAYVKKTVSLRLRDLELDLVVSQSLFSSHRVDTGTRHLLKALNPRKAHSYDKVLDLGCGYGPIGVAMATRNPESSVHLVDRDALAVAFARENARRNGLRHVEAYGSLGYTGVSDRDFDLIAANIPGKAGAEVITMMLQDARHLLVPDGEVAVVVVNPLVPLVSAVLEDPEVKLLDRVEKSAHTVVRYRFTSEAVAQTEPSDEDRAIYRREATTFEVDDLVFEARTARGLPDFDTLSHRTILILKVLADLEIDTPEHMLVLNPGQGHTSVAAWLTQRPHRVTLVGRDLLALRYGRLNVVGNGCDPDRVTTVHRIGLPVENAARYDLMLIELRDDETPEVHAELLDQAAAVATVGSTLLVSGGSTPVTRALKAVDSDKRLLSRHRKKRKGESVAILERR